MRILFVFPGVIAAAFIAVGVLRGINCAKHRIRSADCVDKEMFVTLGDMEQYILG